MVFCAFLHVYFTLKQLFHPVHVCHFFLLLFHYYAVFLTIYSLNIWHFHTKMCLVLHLSKIISSFHHLFERLQQKRFLKHANINEKRPTLDCIRYFGLFCSFFYPIFFLNLKLNYNWNLDKWNTSLVFYLYEGFL